MFDEFLEEYKYNWKMADNQYTEERYRNSLSPKQVEKAQSSPTTSILLRIKWALKNLKMRIEAARFPEILAIAIHYTGHLMSSTLLSMQSTTNETPVRVL